MTDSHQADEYPDVHPCESCRFCGFVRRGNHVADFCAYEFVNGVEREVLVLHRDWDVCSDYEPRQTE